MNNYHALIFSAKLHFWERGNGAHRIATYLRNHGIDVEVVDFAPYWQLERLKEFTKRNVTSKTLFFGVSTIFNYTNTTIDNFLKWLKKEYPYIKTIAGGQNVLQTNLSNIDIWIDSYGEEAILAVAKSLSGNTPNGLIFSPEYFGTKKVIKALHSYPAVNLGDYSIIMEKRDHLEDWEWLFVELSRGCKFSCSFCNFPVLGVKGDVSRSSDNFEYEMKYNFDNFGINRYYIVDETLNDRVEKITKFADVTEKLNFKTLFGGYVRADLLGHQNMISELSRLNVIGQYYGIETFKKESGRVVGKGMCPEKIKSLILDTKQYFLKNNNLYRGTIGLIVGLPYETKEDCDSNMRWLDENWIDQALVPWALSVENFSKDDKGTYTNVSKMSQNLEKYGLRSIGTKEITNFKNKTRNWDYKNVNIAFEEHLWEHDDMNIFEAKEIVEKMRDRADTVYNIATFSLAWPEAKSMKKTSDDSLQASFNISTAKAFPDWSNFKRFIDRYSLKKLNR
jgi:radical SAM superfamily enzyme YgiQ (UPF0313 family)